MSTVEGRKPSSAGLGSRPGSGLGDGRRSARRALALVALSTVLANASWFSATAVVPALERAWRLTSAEAAWLVIAVQLGFVTGSVTAALFKLPDRIHGHR